MRRRRINLPTAICAGSRVALCAAAIALVACNGGSDSASTDTGQTQNPPPSQAKPETFSLGEDRLPMSIAAYPGGGVVAVGLTSARDEIFVTKVAQNGTIEWDKKSQGDRTFLEGIPRVTVGPTGNVFVASATFNDENGVSLNGASQVRVTSFNPSGNLRTGWPQRISVNANNYPSAIATDTQENVFVYGTSSSSNFQANDSYRPFLAAYTSGGVSLGTPGAVPFGGTEPNRRILAGGIAPYPSGGAYLTARVIGFDGSLADNGTGVQIQALDLTGKPYTGFPKRLNQITPAVAALAIAPAGVAYVLGGQLYAINPNGTVSAGFPKDLPAPATGEFGISYNEPTNLVASVTGNLYYTGIAFDQPQSFGNDDVFTESLNGDGNQRSGFPVFSGTAEYDSSIGVAVDASGSNVWTLWYKDANPIVAYVTRTSAN